MKVSLEKCTRPTYNQIRVGYKMIFCKFKETLGIEPNS